MPNNHIPHQHLHPAAFPSPVNTITFNYGEKGPLSIPNRCLAAAILPLHQSGVIRHQSTLRPQRHPHSSAPVQVRQFHKTHLQGIEVPIIPGLRPGLQQQLGYFHLPYSTSHPVNGMRQGFLLKHLNMAEFDLERALIDKVV